MDRLYGSKFGITSWSAWLAVFLIPFISLPVLPSVYRPVSVYFLIIPAFLFLTSRERLWVKQDFFVALFLIYVTVYGFIAGYSNFLFGFELYFKDVIVLLVGSIVYFGFRFVLEMYGLKFFFKVSNLSFKLLLFVGLVEILAIIGVLPSGIKEFMNMFFSGKHQDRVQLTTMEASWGGRVFLFSFVIYLYSSLDKLKIFYVVLALFLFSFIFSVGVVGVLLLAIFVYFVFVYGIKGVVIFLVTTIVFYLLMSVMLDVFSSLGFGGYHLARLHAIVAGDFYQISDMLVYDQSIFIRIGYPLLSVYVYMDNIFGVGLGQYSLYFNDYVVDVYGRSVLTFPEVVGDVVESDGDERSLIFKILVETSFLGLLIFFSVVMYSLRNRIQESYDSFKVFFLILAVTSSFTIGSWAYMYLWIGLAILPAKIEGKYKL
jgi:hypothetical protein